MILKIAHRGASGYEPEDTLRAFKKALEMGADALGIDVHVCKSGEVVVIHDDTLGRTTDARGWVRKKTLSELKSFHIQKGEKISTLEEVLDFVRGKMKLDIELKEKRCAGPTYEIIKRAIRGGVWSYDDFFYFIFYPFGIKKNENIGFARSFKRAFYTSNKK
jgi:glycerophosphoryl diester phosphodiesterase